MPQGNKTGPLGNGPMTGRKLGFCAGYDQPGYMNQPGRSGTGQGRGGRRGFRFMYYKTGLPGWKRRGDLTDEPQGKNE